MNLHDCCCFISMRMHPFSSVYTAFSLYRGTLAHSRSETITNRNMKERTWFVCIRHLRKDWDFKTRAKDHKSIQSFKSSNPQGIGKGRQTERLILYENS